MNIAVNCSVRQYGGAEPARAELARAEPSTHGTWRLTLHVSRQLEHDSESYEVKLLCGRFLSAHRKK